MPSYYRAILILLSVLVPSMLCLDYTLLEFLGVSCPERDKCEGYRNNRSYTDRNCECDSACNTYKDCCVDALRGRSSRQGSSLSRITCLPYGGHSYGGVYVVNKCATNWNGNAETRQKCEEPVDWSDPLGAVPVTCRAQAVTYRNRHCAQCNNAMMVNLQSFQIRLSCQGLPNLSEQQIMDDLVYNQEKDSWGVNRLNSFGNATEFNGCDIIFDVPGYLNSSVRFCRANLISTCLPTWTLNRYRRLCDGYMAVVYDNLSAYRNPHCALCNEKTLDEISCTMDIIGRKRPLPMTSLVDVNTRYGDQVNRIVATPSCPSNHVYDPFIKVCRPLGCALPGHVEVNGQCVSQ